MKNLWNTKKSKSFLNNENFYKYAHEEQDYTEDSFNYVH